MVLLSVDRLLNPVSRKHMPLEEQLKQLLDHLDVLSSMKSSPSRNKRLKLLKKTINDVRSEMSMSGQGPPPDNRNPVGEFKEVPAEPVTQENGAFVQAFMLHTCCSVHVSHLLLLVYTFNLNLYKQFTPKKKAFHNIWYHKRMTKNMIFIF